MLPKHLSFLSIAVNLARCDIGVALCRGSQLRLLLSLSYENVKDQICISPFSLSPPSVSFFLSFFFSSFLLLSYSHLKPNLVDPNFPKLYQTRRFTFRLRDLRLPFFSLPFFFLFPRSHFRFIFPREGASFVRFCRRMDESRNAHV